MTENSINEYDRGLVAALNGHSVEPGASWEYIAGWEDGNDDGGYDD